MDMHRISAIACSPLAVRGRQKPRIGAAPAIEVVGVVNILVEVGT